MTVDLRTAALAVEAWWISDENAGVRERGSPACMFMLREALADSAPEPQDPRTLATFKALFARAASGARNAVDAKALQRLSDAIVIPAT